MIYSDEIKKEDFHWSQLILLPQPHSTAVADQFFHDSREVGACEPKLRRNNEMSSKQGLIGKKMIWLSVQCTLKEELASLDSSKGRSRGVDGWKNKEHLISVRNGIWEQFFLDKNKSKTTVFNVRYTKKSDYDTASSRIYINVSSHFIHF